MMDNRFAFRLAAALMMSALLTLILIGGPARASNSRQEGYPPPAEATPSEAAPLEVTPLPYPPAESTFDSASPISIGGQDGVPNTQAATGEANLGQATPANSRSLLYLWLGFLATLFIFGGCMFGAVLLFTRRNES
jgi:hypothetical protein